MDLSSIVNSSNFVISLSAIQDSEPLELLYGKGELSATQLGEYLGLFFGKLHTAGIYYNNTLEEHLFRHEKELKVTGFEQSTINPMQFEDDVKEAIEYLSNHVIRTELESAVKSFMNSYAKIGDIRIFLAGVRRHIKYTPPEDTIRSIPWLVSFSSSQHNSEFFH